MWKENYDLYLGWLVVLWLERLGWKLGQLDQWCQGCLGQSQRWQKKTFPMALFLESWETCARAHSSQRGNQVQCRLQYFPSYGDKTPWKQLQRKGVYLALSLRVQFPGRESWLQGLLEAGHDASQIRKQRTGFLFIHSRVQTSGTVALTSRTIFSPQLT